MMGHRLGYSEPVYCGESVRRQSVHPYGIIVGVNDTSGSIEQGQQFRIGTGNLEHGFLYSMPVPFAQFGHLSKAASPFRGGGSHVVGQQQLHQLTVQGT